MPRRYDSVVADIIAWWPKLKPGGILFGHDYRHPRFPGDVQIFDDNTPVPLICRLRPDVLVKGPARRGTDTPGAAFVESYGGRVVIPVWRVQHSSTQLVDRIVSGTVAR